MTDRPRQHDPRDDTTIRTSPGASDPGEPGYEGDATVGDEGAAAGREAFEEPFGRPGSGVEE
jgi:hypothetical protein